MKRTVKRVLALMLAFMMIMRMQCFVFAAETVSDVIYDKSAAGPEYVQTVALDSVQDETYGIAQEDLAVEDSADLLENPLDELQGTEFGSLQEEVQNPAFGSVEENASDEQQEFMPEYVQSDAMTDIQPEVSADDAQMGCLRCCSMMRNSRQTWKPQR